jgi:hypothetical protein
VWRKVRLDPGNYVILASTYRPNVPAEFFLRVYSKTGNNLGYREEGGGGVMMMMKIISNRLMVLLLVFQDTRLHLLHWLPHGELNLF